MGTLSRWDLVRHETLGIGRVEAVFGPGENPKCAVYFPRNDQQLMVPRVKDWGSRLVFAICLRQGPADHAWQVGSNPMR